MEDAVRRFRHWGSNSGNEAMFVKAENMRKRIERMEKSDKPKVEKNVSLNFDSQGRSGKIVLKIESLSKKIENKPLFENISLNLYLGEKLGIIGANGSGKSILLEMILEDAKGVTLGSNLKIAYLDQNLTFDDYNVSLIEVFRAESTVKESDIYRCLAKFLFYEKDFSKKIKFLSGGEKARLKLAIMINNGFNFIILDEPTNHLDLPFKELLEKTLVNFDGTLLFISHDRYFLNKIASRIVELKDKTLYDYSGNFNYYLEKNSVKEVKVEKSKKKNSKLRINSEKKENQRSLAKLKKIEIEVLVNIERIDREIEVSQGDYVKLKKIIVEKDELEEQYEILLEKNFELEED